MRGALLVPGSWFVVLLAVRTRASKLFWNGNRHSARPRRYWQAAQATKDEELRTRRAFQKRQRLIIAAPLQEMRELRINRLRQLRRHGGDLPGDFLQPRQVGRRIARIKLAIGNDRPPLAQG